MIIPQTPTIGESTANAFTYKPRPLNLYVVAEDCAPSKENEGILFIRKGQVCSVCVCVCVCEREREREREREERGGERVCVCACAFVHHRCMMSWTHHLIGGLPVLPETPEEMGLLYVDRAGYPAPFMDKLTSSLTSEKKLPTSRVRINSWILLRGGYDLVS